MRPRQGYIIVKANLTQKETIQYKSLTLYIPRRRQLQENGRISNPTLCEVVSANEDYIHEGDLIIVGHNSIGNQAWVISEADGVRTLSLPIDRWVLGKLDAEGNLVPLFGNTICKRITQQDASSIIYTPDAFKKTEENKVEVLSIAPDVADLEVGAVGICHKYSDYEIFWSINGEEKSAIVVWSDEIVGVETEDETLLK